MFITNYDMKIQYLILMKKIHLKDKVILMILLNVVKHQFSYLVLLIQENEVI